VARDRRRRGAGAAPKLLIDAMDHTLDIPSKRVDLYAIEIRIRLTATSEVRVASNVP
jgi:hypothetical protein